MESKVDSKPLYYPHSSPYKGIILSCMVSDPAGYWAPCKVNSISWQVWQRYSIISHNIFPRLSASFCGWRTLK